MDDSLTKQAAMDAVHAAFSTPQAEPGEFTITEYAEYKGIPWSTAARNLKAAASKGAVTRRKALVNRRTTWVYRHVSSDSAS